MSPSSISLPPLPSMMLVPSLSLPPSSLLLARRRSPVAKSVFTSFSLLPSDAPERREIRRVTKDGRERKKETAKEKKRKKCCLVALWLALSLSFFSSLLKKTSIRCFFFRELETR